MSLVPYDEPIEAEGRFLPPDGWAECPWCSGFTPQCLKRCVHCGHIATRNLGLRDFLSEVWRMMLRPDTNPRNWR